MANGRDDDPTPYERARERLERAGPDDEGDEPTPYERARRRLDQAGDGGGQQADTDSPAPQAGTMGIPEAGDPDPTQDEEGEWRNFFEMVVTQAERGFRSATQQRAARRGVEATERDETAGETAVSRQSGLGPGTFAEEQAELPEEEQQAIRRKAAETIKRQAEQLQSQNQTQAMRRLNEAIQTGEAGAVVDAVWENPEAAVGLSVQSTAMQPESILGTLLVGMASGPGAAVTGAAGANQVESRAAIVEELRKRGVDLQDAETVQETLADPEFVAAARERGEARGATIGAVDLATNLLTFGLGSTGLRPIAKGVLGFGTQVGGESVSEAAAQAAAGEEMNPAEILSEGLASGPQSIAETFATQFQAEDPAARARRRARELVGEARDQSRAAERADQVGTRPYRDVDDARLERMKDLAREKRMDEELRAIEREQQLREQEEQADEQETDPDRAQDEGRRGRGGEDGERGDGAPRPGPRDGATDQGAPARPEDPLSRAREALEEARGQERTTETDRREDATDRLGVSDLPEDPAPEIDARREEESDQAAMDEVMDEAARSETRPEEQVAEEVQRLEQEAQEAEWEVDRAKQDLLDTLADVEAEEIDRLAEQTEDDEVERLATLALQQREEQGTLGDMAPREKEDPATPQTPGLFSEQEDAVSSAVQRAADKLKQRRAGLEQKRQEALRAREQEQDAKQRARESQQELDPDEQETDRGETEGDPQVAGTELDGDEGAQGAEQPVREEAEPGERDPQGTGAGALAPGEAEVSVREPIAPPPETGEEVEESDAADPATDEEGEATQTDGDGTAGQVAAGTVEARVGRPDGDESVATAELTDEALTIETAESPEAAAQLAEEAASRDVPLQTSPEVDASTAETVMRLAEQGYEVHRAANTERTVGGGYEADGPVFTIEPPQVDADRPTTQTEDDYTVGFALRAVTRKTTRSERPQGQMTDRPVEELEAELQEARDRDDAEFAEQVQEALNTIRTQSRQTTYTHKRGDIVVRNAEGRLVDRRSPKYDDVVAEFFAEHEETLREGTVEPTASDQFGARAALQSSSPQQVLDAFYLAHQSEQDVQEAGDSASIQEQLIRDKGRYDTDSVRGVAGSAVVENEGALRMNWLSASGKPLDAAAQEITAESGIETTPQDIIDYITENPTRSTRSVVDELREYFQELTGIALTPELAEQIRGAQRPDPQTDPIDVDAPFQTLGAEGPATDATIVEAILRRITGDLEIPLSSITIVESPSGLEGEAASIYEQGTRQAGRNQIRPAMYVPGPDGGEVYVVAEAVAGAAKGTGYSYETMARMSLMHEAVAHQGLRALLGDSFGETMDLLVAAVGRTTLMNATTSDGTRLVDANADQMEVEDGALTQESLRLLMDEYLASVAEGMAIQNSTLETLYQSMKTGVARTLNLQLTKGEFGVLLNASKEHLRALDTEIDLAGSRFDRSMDAQAPARWMVLGTEAEDFDAAEEQGAVFRGPYDDAVRFEIDDSNAEFHPDGPIKRFAELVEKRHNAKLDRYDADRTDDMEAREEAVKAQAEADFEVRNVKQTMRAGVPVDRVLNHQELYDQYPHLTDELTVFYREEPVMGWLNYEAGNLVIGQQALDKLKQKAQTGDPLELYEGLSVVMKTVLHELQHWVQQEEGFAVGSSPSDMMPQARQQLTTAMTAANDLRNMQAAEKLLTWLEENDRDAGSMTTQELRDAALHRNWPEERVGAILTSMRVVDFKPDRASQHYTRLHKMIRGAGVDPTDETQIDMLQRAEPGSEELDRWVRQRATNMYRRAAGEIEARITQERRNWTIPERQREGFYEDIDAAYDPDDVIVRFSTYSEDPDQTELFADPNTEAERDMVALHNLNESKVRFAVEEMGGHIPVPSVATARYQHGFARFGNITLVGRPELVDPGQGVPTFDSDIWSPTSPDPQYNHRPPQVEEVLGTLYEYASEIGETSKVSSLDYKVREQDDRRHAVSQLSRMNAARMWYLDEVHDRQVEIPMSDYSGQFVQLFRHGPLEEYLLEAVEEHADFAKEVAGSDPDLALREEFTEKVVASGRAASMSKYGEVSDQLLAALKGTVLGPDNKPKFAMVEKMIRELRQKQETPEVVDGTELSERLKAAIEEQGEGETHRDVIHPWAVEKADQMFGEPYLEDPATGEQIPPSLDHLVRIMTSENVQAAEDALLTTLSNARAAGAERFESLSQMQDQRDRIVSRDEMEQVKETLKQEWESVRENLFGHYEGDPMARSDFGQRMSARDDVTKALGEMMQRSLTARQARRALERHRYPDVPAGAVKSFIEFGRTLQESPTQYFESKPQRAVALDEFVAAIVPSDTDGEVKEMLGEEVGEVYEYEPNDEADRQGALSEASEGVRFQSLSTQQMGHRFMTANDGQAQMDVRRDLIALHNLRAEGIDWIFDKMGGHIPAPSVAITKAEVTQFEVYDDRNQRVFQSADAESPQEALDEMAEGMGFDSFEDYTSGTTTPERDDYRVEQAGQPEGFTRFGDVTLVATQAAIDPSENPVFAGDAYTPTTRMANIREGLSGEQYRALQTRIESIYNDALAQFNNNELREEVDVHLDAWWDEYKGHLMEVNHSQSDVWTRILSADDVGVDVVDAIDTAARETMSRSQDGILFNGSRFDNKLKEELNERLRAQTPRSTVGVAGDWMDALETTMEVEDPNTGNWVDATPQAIANAMTYRGIRNVQGGAGAGPTRAEGARNFESLEELQAARDQVIGRDDVSDMKMRSSDLLTEVGEQARKIREVTDHSAKNVGADLIQAVYQIQDDQGEVTVDDVVARIADTHSINMERLRDLAGRDVSAEEEREQLVQARRQFVNGEKQGTWVMNGYRVDPDEARSVFTERERRHLRQMVTAWGSGTQLQAEYDLWKGHLLDSLNERIESLTDQERHDESEQLQRLRSAISDATTATFFDFEPATFEAEDTWLEFVGAQQDYQDKIGAGNRAAEAKQRLTRIEETAEVALENANELKSLETQYFEAKPARAVSIDEFHAAIVPEDLGEERVQKLQEAGLKIREYSNRSERRSLQAQMEEVRFITRDFQDEGGPFAENEMDVPLQRAENPQTLGDYWTNFKAFFRRQFATRGDLPADVYEATEGRRGQIKAWLQRTQWAVQDFQQAVQDTFEGDQLTEEQVRTINEALGNGFRDNDVDQESLFADDPQIEEAVPMSDFWFSAIPHTTEETLRQKTYIEDLPEPLQSAAAELRDTIDAMSHAGIQTGLFRGKLRVAVERNMGTYLTRSYKIHNEPEYGATLRQAARDLEDGITMDPDQVPEGVPATAWNRSVGWFRQNHPHMSDEQIQARLLELLNQEQGRDVAQQGTLGSVGQAIFERRQEIPEPLRALLGQYEDPATNFTQTMTKMAHAVANQSLLNTVKKKGLNRFLFTEPRVIDGVSYEHQISAEGSRTMQPLNGLYTTPEIARAFEQFDVQESMPGWQEAFMKLSVGVKTVKTVGSVKTQFRNYYGNILFALSQGHLFSPRVAAGAAGGAAAGAAAGGPIGAVPGAAVGTVAGLTTQAPKQKAWNMAIASMKQDFSSEEQRAEFQRMLELGIVGDAVRAGELEALFEDLDLDLDDPQTGMGEIADQIVGATGRTLTKLYQLGDEIWKVYAFEIEKQRYAGAKPDWTDRRVEEKAAERVKNSYPTYSQVPEFLKSLRRLPTNAPFVSFFSEVFRTTYHSARFIKEDLADPDTRHIGMQRAVGFIMAQGAMKALYEVSKALTGYDDEDDEYLRRLLPSWSQFSNLFHLPAPDGKASYLDLGYLNPYKAYGEFAIAAMTGDDIDPWRTAGNAVKRLLDPFISEEILSQKVREAITNRSTETGAPIANPALKQNDFEEFWARRFWHILKAFEPTTSKDVRGLISSMDAKGLYEDGDPTQEIMSLFAGQRIKTIDMAERIKWETMDFEEQYRNASRLFTSVLTERGTVDAGEVENAYRQSIEAKQDIIKHMHEDVNAAMNFGLSPRSAYTVLRSNDVGSDRAMMVMAGAFLPQPDENVLVSRIEAALAEGREDDARAFRRRREFALQAMQRVQEEYIEQHPSLLDRFEQTRRLLRDNTNE